MWKYVAHSNRNPLKTWFHSEVNGKFDLCMDSEILDFTSTRHVFLVNLGAMGLFLRGSEKYIFPLFLRWNHFCFRLYALWRVRFWRDILGTNLFTGNPKIPLLLLYAKIQRGASKYTIFEIATRLWCQIRGHVPFCRQKSGQTSNGFLGRNRAQNEVFWGKNRLVIRPFLFQMVKTACPYHLPFSR